MASQYRRRSLMLNTIAKVAQGNPTIITDSSSRRLKRLDIYGQSEQDSTTGAQLLDPSLYKDSVTGGGVTYTKQSDGSIKREGTATERIGNIWIAGSYFESKDTPNYKVLFTLSPGTYTIKDCLLYSLATSYRNTFIIDNPLEVTGIRNKDFEIGKTYNDVIYPMLYEGSATLPFEPYTGGKPSPSPDYPQEIISKEVSSIIVSNGASESQTITLTDPITLRGIPVSSGGNVTIDGQQYISDVITEKDGVIGVERDIEAFSLAIADMNNNENFPGWKPLDVVDKILPPQANDTQIINALCTIQSRTIYATRDTKLLYFSSERLGKTQAELIEQYPDLSVDFAAISYEPTFEPLPEEVQAQYKALKSYYPNTVIQTGCWNEVTYSAKRGG